MPYEPTSPGAWVPGGEEYVFGSIIGGAAYVISQMTTSANSGNATSANQNVEGVLQNDEIRGGYYAQGNIKNDNYDPFSYYEPASRLNLCASPYWEKIEETFSGAGTPFDAMTGVREYTRQFHVRVKVPDIGPALVCACPGVPMPYAPYIPGRRWEWDLQARAIKISAARRNPNDPADWQEWVVTVQYSTNMPPGGPIAGMDLGWNSVGPQNSPWDEPPHLEWDPEVTTTYPLADRDGNPFLNAAGQMHPPPPLEDGVAVLVVTRNWRFASLEQCKEHIERYSFVVNQAPFVGAAKGKVLSLPPRATEMYRGLIRYWRMTYRLKFRPTRRQWGHDDFPDDSWQPKVLNAGQYQLKSVLGVPVPNTLVPIYIGNQAVNYPVPLSGAGLRAEPGDENFLVYRYYDEVDFNDIILPPWKL